MQGPLPAKEDVLPAMRGSIQPAAGATATTGETESAEQRQGSEAGGEQLVEQRQGSEAKGSQPPNQAWRPQGYSFPQQLRLKRPAEFERCFAAKRSTADSVLIVYVCENQLPYPRLGCVVSRKCGRAVRRNRYKRLLREAFRLSQHDLPAGIDYVVLPRPSEPLPTLDQVRRSLLRLGRLAVRRLREAKSFPERSQS
jgi:ribonuclease P protein component